MNGSDYQTNGDLSSATIFFPQPVLPLRELSVSKLSPGGTAELNPGRSPTSANSFARQ